MRKHFLLLLWLTLLPLAGWAHTAVWTSGNEVEEFSYTGSQPTFNLTVQNGYQGYPCEFVGVGTTAPTGYNNQYRYSIHPTMTDAQSGTNQITTPVTDAGTYWLRVSVRGRNPGTGYNFQTEYFTLSFKINKIDNSITGFAMNDWTEGGTPEVPSYTSATFGTPTWQYSIDGGNSWSTTAPTTHGYYKVRAFIDESTNYNAFTSEVKDYKIFKAAELTTVPSLAPGLVYNDGDLSLISGTPAYPVDYSTTTGGVIYKVTDVLLAPTDDTDAVNEPTKKDAGTYYVWYKVKGDGDLYVDGAWKQVGTTAVKIAKRDITATDFTITGETLTYNGDYQALIAKFEWKEDVDRGTEEFGASTTGPWGAIDALTGKDVNTTGYPVFVNIAGDANHNDYTSAAAEISVPITEAAPEIADQKDKIVTGLEYVSADKKLLSAELVAVLKGTDTGTFTYYVVDPDGNETSYTNWEDVVGDGAGEYTIYYSFDAGTDYTPVAKTELGKTTIAKSFVQRTGGPTLTATALTYSGAPLALLDGDFTSITGGTVTYYALGENFENTAEEFANAADVKKTNADTYTVAYKFFADASGNFKDDEDQTLIGTSVEIKQVGLAVAGEKVNDVYTLVPGTNFKKEDLFKFDKPAFVAGESDDEQTAIVSSLINVVIKDKEGNEIKVDTETGALDAGNYDIILSVNSEATVQNYKVNDLTDGLISIAQAENKITDLSITGWTYGDAANDPSVTADFGAADVTYEYYKDSEKLEAVPTDAGDYTVKAIIEETVNFKGAEETTDFTIAPADLAITVADATKVYGTDDPTFSVEGTPAYQNGDDAEKIGLTFEREEGEDVGEYAIDAAITSQNYNFTFTPGKLTITTADLTITVADKEKTYGDEDPEFTATVEGLVGEETAETIGLKFEREEGETVDEYAIKATAEKAGNYAVTFNDGKLTINKAELTLTAADATKVFEDEDPELVLAEAPAYKNGDDAEKIGLTITREAGEDVGEYAITPAATSENYEFTFVDGTFTITQQPVTPTAPKALALTYNGLDQALVIAGEAKGSTIKYAITAIDGTPVDGALAENIPEAKNAATYTVSYAFEPGKNFSIADELAEGTVDVKINKAHVSYRMGNQTETYTGEAFAPVEGQAYQLVDGDLMVGDEDAFTFDWVEGFDATTAAEEGRVFTDLVATFKDGIENYTIQCVQEGKLYIKKAKLEKDVHYTAPVAIEGLVYDPTGELNPQELVTKGSVVEVDDKPLGTIMFAMGETAPAKDSSDWTVNVPTATDASGYDVWYYVAGDANHNDTEPFKIADVAIASFELADNMLPTEYQEGKIVEADYTAEVQNFDIALTGLEKGVDYEVELDAEEIKDAGLYTFTFTGIGNYTGELTAQVNIKKLELIATAPNAKKTYDGTNKVEEGEFGVFEFNGLLKGDKIDLGDLTVADVISVPADAINVGTYTLEVNLTEFPEQTNYVIKTADILPGTLTIDPAAPVTIGFKEGVTYSKSYATEDNLAVIADDLTATEGDLFVEPAEFAQLLKISREPGEVYKEDGYTVSLDFENQESLLEAIAKFKKNYEGVSFGTTKFFITPFAGNIKVSIASASSVYDGTVPTYGWDTEEDTYLSNMVVTGIDADKKAEIFSKLPTVTISGITRNAGDYNIELAKDFETVNFDPEKITLVLGSYYTIEQFDLANATVTIPKQQAKVGDVADDVIDYTDFTITGIPVDADAAGFILEVADDFVDADGNIVEGADFSKGLVLVGLEDDPKTTDVDESQIAANYTGWENGEITGNLIVEGGEELVLDDSGAITTTSTGDKTVKVTFTSRTINAGTWNVLVLPFDVTPAQVSNAFGYAVVDVLNKEKNSKGDIHFMINTTETVPAGKPFIVKPGKDLAEKEKENFTEITFTGVKVKAFDDNTEDVDDNGNKFIGTFKDTQIGGKQYRYMSKGMWYDARNFESKPLTIKPLRAFIEMAPENVNARIFIEEADGTVTAIDGVTFNNELNEGMYNLNGMKVNNLNRKGVFIQNGKKVIK